MEYPERIPAELLFRQDLVSKWVKEGLDVFLDSPRMESRTQKEHLDNLSREDKVLSPLWVLGHAMFDNELVNLQVRDNAFMTSTIVIGREGSDDVYIAHQVDYGSKRFSRNKYNLVSPVGGLVFRVQDFPKDTIDLRDLVSHPQTLEALFLMTPEKFEKGFLQFIPETPVFWPSSEYVFTPVPNEEYMDSVTRELGGLNQELEPELEGDLGVIQKKIQELVQKLGFESDVYSRESIDDELEWLYEEAGRLLGEEGSDPDEKMFELQRVIDESVRKKNHMCYSIILGNALKKDGLKFRGENLGKVFYKTVVFGGFKHPCSDQPLFGVSLQELEDVFPGTPIVYEG